MAEHPSKIYLGRSPRLPTAPHRWPLESEERRSRAPEFYGFVAWTSTYLLFFLYILWATLPEQYIEKIGITWYPSRYVCWGFLLSDL
jgi:phosphatidylinositol glycan class P protein